MEFHFLIFNHKRLTMNIPNIEYVLYQKFMRNGCGGYMAPACRLLKTQWFIFRKMKFIFYEVGNQSNPQRVKSCANVVLDEHLAPPSCSLEEMDRIEEESFLQEVEGGNN